jgi:acetyl-CoA C-acetyltransferase
MESMSNAPYLLTRVRDGLRLGNSEVLDSMIVDGLWCASSSATWATPAR